MMLLQECALTNNFIYVSRESMEHHAKQIPRLYMYETLKYIILLTSYILDLPAMPRKKSV